MLRSITFLTACLIVVQACQSPDPVTQADRPNILWITCEDISPHLGCYGDERALTPHLDRLAQEGVVYLNAFASAPVCAVARSSIITGLYASSQGTQHMRCSGRLPEGVQTYPEMLRKGGYYCTNNVKTDYNLDIDHKAIWDDCSSTAHWRNRPDDSQPFFSIFNYTTSHESRVNNADRYQEAVADLPASMLRSPDELTPPPYFPATGDVKELWARYYNIITAMDQQVGALLEELEQDGLAENTVVIFYSDHGAGVPRHKRWLFDSGLRVPLIVRMPEKYKRLLAHEQGTQTRELVSFIDLPPTALHLAGVEVPDHMQGRAFLGQNLTTPRSYVMAGRDRMDERYDMQRAVRDQRYKYIVHYEPYKPFCQYMNTPEKGAIMQAIRAAQANGTMPVAGQHIVALTKPFEMLFDCQEDPDELVNLAELPQHKSKLEELRGVHASWSDDIYDTGLIPETILRDWEQKYGMSIYDIMRRKQIPVGEIRRTALGQLDQRDLTRNLSHKNAAVRYWAAISLGNLAEQQPDQKALVKALEDEVAVVRFAAARALDLVGQSPAALPALQDGLQHADEWVRLAAAQFLDEMGERARPALSSLQGVMGDKNKYVVRVANHAINFLNGMDNVVP